MKKFDFMSKSEFKEKVDPDQVCDLLEELYDKAYLHAVDIITEGNLDKLLDEYNAFVSKLRKLSDLADEKHKEILFTYDEQCDYMQLNNKKARELYSVLYDFSELKPIKKEGW